MPVLKVELDLESLQRLTELAARERRPVDWQAEVLLLQALNRWPVPVDLHHTGVLPGAAAAVEQVPVG